MFVFNEKKMKHKSIINYGYEYLHILNEYLKTLNSTDLYASTAFEDYIFEVFNSYVKEDNNS